MDAPVVDAAAPGMEQLYADVFLSLGLSPIHGAGAPDGRLAISVHEAQQIQWDTARDQVTLPPLGQIETEHGWSQEDMLRQSWAIALVGQATLEAAETYEVPDGWQPLLGGLRLWLLWETGGPLADSRDAIAAWHFANSQHYVNAQRGWLAEVDQICATYALWQQSPLHYGIPLACGPADNAAIPRQSPTERLADLHLPEATWYAEDEPNSTLLATPSRARGIALALLLDYAVEFYGRDSLPELLKALKIHTSWETLIPAVYAVSAAKFESDWTAYLANIIQR